MPVLAAAALVLPADLVAVHAGDVDLDGVDELVLESRHDKGDEPDAVTLTIVDFGADGRETGRSTVALGNDPVLWNASKGLWLIDGQGLVQVQPDGTRVLVHERVTPLVGLGPTTPTWGDFAHDIDHDGDIELLVWARGRIEAVAAAGTVHGSVPAPAEGALSASEGRGGRGLQISTRLPTTAVGDIDGDGIDDLLFPERDRLTAWVTATGIGDRKVRYRLPFDLQPRDRGIDRESEQRRVASAWFEDADGRPGVELLVHRIVTRGSWFGSTAELVLARPQGDAITVVQQLETDAAAVDVRSVDFEGDGDKDLLVPTIDANMGNLASALVSKTVKVDTLLYLMQDGRYADEPIHLGKLKIPIDRSDTYQVEVSHDLTGDGIVDRVTNDGEQLVRIYAGERYAFGGEPVAEVAVPVPAGEGTLFVRDLTGDGRAEVVVWGRDERQGRVLVLR